MADMVVKATGTKEVYCGYWAKSRFSKTLTFISIVEDDVTKYYVGGVEVTKEEGNKQYKELKESANESFETEKMSVNLANMLLDILYKSIDQYTEYIDNYRQQKQAEESNRKIQREIDILNKWLAANEPQNTPEPTEVKVEETPTETPTAPVKKTKIQERRDTVKQMLETDDEFLYEALTKLYNCQTQDEQSSEQTREHNGMGFNALDAGFLSSVAKSLKEYGRLTEKQLVITRRKMVKYTGQIVKLMAV